MNDQQVNTEDLITVLRQQIADVTFQNALLLTEIRRLQRQIEPQNGVST